MRVPAALAHAFRAEATDKVFTVMGSANMEWQAEMAATAGVVVDVRHELAAVAAADGYARVTGGVGVASVTYGPGLTHAATSLRAAVRNRSSVVVLTGEFTDPTHIQYVDQPALVAALGATYVRVQSAASCLDDTRKAFYLARTSPGPVVLAVPGDIQRQEGPDPRDYAPSSRLADRRPRIQADPATVRAIAGQLRSAERPVILVGRGAMAGGPPNGVLELAERIGALTASTLPAQGWIRDEPFHLGLSGYFSQPEARALLDSADLLLVLGASLNRHATSKGTLYQSAYVVVVDELPYGAYETAVQTDDYVTSDAGAFVDAVLEEVGELALPKWRTPDTEKVAQRARAIQNSPFVISDARLDPRPVLETIDRHFPSDRILALGAGHFFGFAIKNLVSTQYPRLDTYAFAPVGQGLPTAIGAACVDGDRPVLLVEGDSGFHMNIQELDTLVRLKLPILTVVMNNAALGSEYYHLPERGYDGNLAVLPEVDFAAIARGYGIMAGTVANDPNEVIPLVRQFVETRQPMLIDVKISKDVVNPNWGG